MDSLALLLGKGKLQPWAQAAAHMLAKRSKPEAVVPEMEPAEEVEGKITPWFRDEFGNPTRLKSCP